MHARWNRLQAPPVRDALVLSAAVGVFGVSFGVLAVSSGLTVLQACAMSLLVFTGASQFAAIGLTAAGSDPSAAVGSALLLGARHLAYGVALGPIFSGSRRTTRAVAAQVMIDESTAMATAQGNPIDARAAFWAAGLGVYVFWNLGTLAGALVGNGIGDPTRYGLDAAFPCGFLALIVAHVRDRGGQTAAALATVIALALVSIVPAGLPVLVASAAIIPGMVVRARLARRSP